jgi:hypothetical protein
MRRKKLEEEEMVTNDENGSGMLFNICVVVCACSRYRISEVSERKLT